MNTQRSQAGFSIVEVMVALVVLAVGMLGIASLYVTTLRSSGSAISRMQAVNLAGDMADRIRANPFGRGDFEGDGAENDCVDTFNCSRELMAKSDVYLWKQQIAAVLPGDARGTIEFLQAGELPEDAEEDEEPDDLDQYVITVSWTEPGEQNPASYALTMAVDP